MQSVDITFPEAEPGTASQLAQELRRQLIQSGVAADQVAVSRTDAENMDPGTMLQIASISVEALAIALTLYEIATRHRQPMTVVTAKGSASVQPGDPNVESVRVLLNEAASGSGK